MASNQRYAIGVGWKPILAEVGIDPTDVLRRARLPEDLLSHENVQLTAESLFRFAAALDASLPDPSFWVHLTEAMSPEWFTPPVFAALCSPDLVTASSRLSRFKPLVGPIQLAVRNDAGGLTLTYRWTDKTAQPPACMHGVEAMFVVQLARLGTRVRIKPTAVTVPELPAQPDAFNTYLGVTMKRGDAISVSFSAADATRPFLTSNGAMWRIFEPELRRRLADLQGSATFSERTRAVLVEALPSGQGAMDLVARRLAVSGRTLQRRLRQEGTSFKTVVAATRESLVRHYLSRTQLSLTEISYLLGFEEPTSFFRAFHRWTGMTPEAARQRLRASSDSIASNPLPSRPV